MNVRCFLRAAIFLLWCVVCTSAVAETRRVYILQTTDVHAQIFPTYEGTGGFLSLATRLKTLIQQFGRENVLLIDTGDTVQGGVCASLTRGRVGMIPLNYLDYDVWVPGNHEFDYGVDDFVSMMNFQRGRALCANLAIVNEPPYTPWRMFERNGVRIAVIGLAPSYMPNWLLPEENRRVRMTSSIELLKTLLPQITRESPDVVVVAAHQGLPPSQTLTASSELAELATRYPEIDIILGGHTHRIVTGQHLGKRAWFVQAGYHGSQVGVVTVDADTQAHRVVSVSSAMMPVTTDDAPDAELQSLLSSIITQTIREQKRPLQGGFSRAVLSDGTPGVNCATSELICRAIAEEVGADVVLHGRLSKKDIPAGKLTADMLYKLIPYDNTIVTAWLTPAQLEAIIAEQCQWRRHYSYNGLYGAYARVKKGTGRSDFTVTLTGLAGQSSKMPLPRDQRLLVALNNHAAAGSGRFKILRRILEEPESKLSMTGVDVRTAVEHYIARHAGVAIIPVRWLLE